MSTNELQGFSGRYFHELSQEEVDQFRAMRGVTVGDILAVFRQPEWCGYPEALSMQMGCWSLCDMEPGGTRTKISRAFCGTCNCYCCGGSCVKDEGDEKEA